MSGGLSQAVSQSQGTVESMGWYRWPQRQDMTGRKPSSSEGDARLRAERQRSLVWTAFNSDWAAIVGNRGTGMKAITYERESVLSHPGMSNSIADSCPLATDDAVPASQPRQSLVAGLFLAVVSILLLPMGIVLRDGFAGTPAATGFIVAPDTLSDSVAATPGQFRVSESGAATYAMPLFTVPGTAGVVPQLSLSYSSQGGDSTIAKGWAISGLSAITRCRATRESGDFIVNGVAGDGDPSPINFTSADRYCLDGQRLVPADDGIACPAVAGMTVQNLRTELQSFQRVCAYTPSGGSVGVSFFTVDRKDGSTSWYGDRDNSLTANRPDGYINSTASGKEAFALSWAQTRFQDSTGNYIDYLYSEGTEANGNQGEHLISKVRYTGKTPLPGQPGAAQAPYAELTFSYSLGTFKIGTTTVAIDRIAYLAGGKVRSRSRLTSITSSVDHDFDGAFETVRFYAMDYGIARTAEAVLNSVTECRDATREVCAAPTVFEWSTPRTTWGDDDLFQTWEQTAGVPNGSLTKFEGLKFGDIDGDGRQDLIWLKDGSAGEPCPSKTVNLLYSRLNASGNPTLQNAGTVFCAPNGLYWNPQDYSWFLLDYDGDGRDDYFQRTDTNWIAYRATGNQAQPFDTSVNMLAELAVPIPSGADKYSEPQQADVNGDGLADLVYPSNGSLVMRIMERGGSYGFRWGAPRAVSLHGDGCTTGNCYVVSGLYRKGNYLQLNDFNGDARSDLLVKAAVTCSGGGTPPPGGGGGGVNPLRTTSVTTSSTTCFRVLPFTVTSITSNQVALDRYGTIVIDAEDLHSFADVNGDGLTDDVYMGSPQRSQGNVAVFLNTGADFVNSGQPVMQVVNYQYAQVADVNGDGRADYVYPDSNGDMRAKYGTSIGYLAGDAVLGPTLLGCTSAECLASRSHLFADVDGDGNVDYMRIKWDNDSNSPVTYSRGDVQNRFVPRDTLLAVTNGYGARTEISYAPLTLKDLYRPDTGTRNTANWGRGSPVQDIFGPMYVVDRVSSTSVAGSDPSAKSTLFYRYNGAKMQAGGRGILGFREAITIDPNQTGGYVTTVTQYAQNFPFAGLPTQTVKRAAINMVYVPSACLGGAPADACFAPRDQPGASLVGTAFSQSTQSWEAVSNSGAVFSPGHQEPLHARTAGTVEAVADPFTATQTGWTSTAFVYGANGNVLQTSVDTYAGSSGTLVSSVTTNNAYTDDVAAWRLGRLTGSTVTHKRPGMPDVVRSTWFGYAMTGPKTGMLVEERIQPTVSVDQDLRKVYTLDDYGNRVFNGVCTQQVADCRSTNIQFSMWDWNRVHRYSRQAYDARGRFPVATYELFRPSTATDINTQPIETMTSEVLQRDVFGNVTEVVGLNNVRSVARFGALGRAYYAWQQTDPAGSVPNAMGTVGASNLITFRWCNTGTGAVTCPAHARFRAKSTATAAPTQWVYFDALGREVLKVSQSFNAGASGKDATGACIEYDAAGRAARTSTPFFLAGTTASGEPDVANVCASTDRRWARTEFDVLGRPVKVVEPNNATSTVAYSGTTTTSTNARGYTKVEIRNALGELVQATDAAGLSTFYAYDAAGNLGAVTRNADRGAITTSMGYDALGRKTYMNDPDGGVRYLGYNALGELLIEHDGAGLGKQQRYDFRGRIQWRGSWYTKADGSTPWDQSAYTNWDTAANGLGQEHCVYTEAYAYQNWAGQSDKLQVWSRCNTFDAMGRVSASATYIDGVSYASAVVFDSLGRPLKSQDPSGKWLKTEYGPRGQALRLCESSATDMASGCATGVATTYLENQETDAFGNLIRDTRGGIAAMQTFRQYDPLTGRLSEICAGSDTVSCQIMRDRYVWDSVGNLNWRDRKDYGEDFWYDSVDRLQVSRLNRAGGTTYAYGSGQITDWTDYDKLGNVCAHWMRGSQSMGYFYAGRTGCGLNGSLGGPYNTSLTDSPHQVRQTSAYSSFVYDSHGNQTFADSAASDNLDRTIRYNAQDQAYEILKGPAAAPSRTARFWYDPSGSRYKREDTGVGIVGTRRTLYVGNLEVVTENGTTTYKRYIGGMLVQNVVNGVAANRYLFQDHLGSTVAVTNEAGAFVEGGGFNAFGERRTNGSATGITTTGLSATTRGFTGHEMLDDGLDVIHMNGRIYDPTLGRFLQADPVIQDTSTPQAWNAYTYVFNNPYRYTDPTGMIGVEERQWLAMAVTIAATWYAPQVWGAAYAAAGGAAAGATAAAAANAAVVGFTVATGAVAGGISGGSNGAVMGAFSALAFYGIGQAFSGMQGAAGTGFLGSGFTSGEFAAKVLAHGIAGGVMAELQGGKFGNGFVSAAGAELASPYIDSIGDGQTSYAGVRVAVAALVGGTVSALTGGKFASGALAAAFGRAFNSEPHAWQLAEKAAVKQIAEAYAEKGIQITILEQVKIGVRLPNGSVVNAIADHAYMVDGVVHFGEVKMGMFARLTKNQKVVYSAINAGKVFFVDNGVARQFGFKAGAELFSARLTLHAIEGSRAWRQVGRLIPTAGREGLGKVLSFLGGAAFTGVTLYLEVGSYDPVSSMYMSCPKCNPSASFDMN